MAELLEQGSTPSEVISTAAWVIGSAVKYNPDVQHAALQQGMLPLLVQQLNHTLRVGADAKFASKVWARIVAHCLHVCPQLNTLSPVSLHLYHPCSWSTRWGAWCAAATQHSVSLQRSMAVPCSPT